MMEQEKQSAFESRLPQDPAYWSDLATRITDNSAPLFARRQSWWGPLDRFGTGLSIGALAAAGTVLAILPAGDAPHTPTSDVTTVAAVSPADLLGNAFVSQPTAPDVVTLMVLGTEESP